MADLEMNKLFAAPLVAGVAFMGAGLLGELIVHPHKLERSAIQIGQVAAPAAAPAAAAAPALEPIGPLMAAANVENGRQLASRNCSSCHSFNEGGRAGVGPNLYGIVGKNHAQVAGFNYSAANIALASKPWGYEELNAFINAPARAMPGTRMAFAGLANHQQRADVIAYLRSLAASPVPLP
jgi:cytochrome c